MDLTEEAKKLNDELIRYRRYLHEHAEVGFAMNQTKEFVKNKLREIGLEPKDCGISGITAQIRGKSERTILLRADMDALPIHEDTGLSFACKTNNMHACGHDMHTAMLLGAAKLLVQRADSLNGTVRLMFQPAEEVLLGAKNMIENGILDHPKPDAAIMIHVSADRSIGTVRLAQEGVVAPAADTFEIQVHGLACHGSVPYKGINALTAAAHILLALQQIPAQEVGTEHPSALSVGRLHGGDAANAVADLAVLNGTLRSFDIKTQENMKFRIRQIAEGVASAFRATATVTFPGGCPPFENNTMVKQTVESAIRKQMRGINIIYSTGRSISGSEDFAFVSQHVPSALISLSCGANDHPLHHPKVEFDENALWMGAGIYAAAAMEFLTIDWSEHNERQKN